MQTSRLDRFKLAFCSGSESADHRIVLREQADSVQDLRLHCLAVSRADYERMSAPVTALFVGSPELIVEKIWHQHQLYGHQRFIAQMDIGGIPFKRVQQNIELLATKVVPAVRRALNK